LFLEPLALSMMVGSNVHYAYFLQLRKASEPTRLSPQQQNCLREKLMSRNWLFLWFLSTLFFRVVKEVISDNRGLPARANQYSTLSGAIQSEKAGGESLLRRRSWGCRSIATQGKTKRSLVVLRIKQSGAGPYERAVFKSMPKEHLGARRQLGLLLSLWIAGQSS
jgi:hypothetical protein